jgi:hypothetical protein
MFHININRSINKFRTSRKGGRREKIRQNATKWSCNYVLLQTFKQGPIIIYAFFSCNGDKRSETKSTAGKNYQGTQKVGNDLKPPTD